MTHHDHMANFLRDLATVTKQRADAQKKYIQHCTEAVALESECRDWTAIDGCDVPDKFCKCRSIALAVLEVPKP